MGASDAAAGDGDGDVVLVESVEIERGGIGILHGNGDSGPAGRGDIGRADDKRRGRLHGERRLAEKHALLERLDPFSAARAAIF